MNKKIPIGMVIIGIIILSLSFKTNAVTSFNTEKQVINSISLALAPHEPIEIFNDGNFSDYGFSGSGISGDPFIIDSYEIITTSNYGIFINGTTKHFVISNCYVAASGTGIRISFASEGTASVVNNTCVNHQSNGIIMIESSVAEIANNTCINNGYGIYLSSSDKINVTDNKCNYNHHYGLRTSYSAELIISNNSFSYNDIGMYLYHSNTTSILNSTLDNNFDSGIIISHTYHATLKNNYFYNTGLHITKYSAPRFLTYTLENNWVNDKKLGFFINQNEVTLIDPIYGQLIIINCIEVVVRNQEIFNTNTALFIADCEDCIITDNICNNNKMDGIYICDSSIITLTDNVCNNNYAAGIELSYSTTAIVSNNNCSSNAEYGMLLRTVDSLTLTENYASDNNEIGFSITGCHEATVTNNIVTKNANGQGLEIYYCQDAIVTDNNVTNNGIGISVGISPGTIIENNTCDDNAIGIFLISYNNTITKNTCKKNTDKGIFLYFSDYCLITYNLIQENYGYGLYLSDKSKENKIHHNSFIANNPGGTSQAYDIGVNNTWYDEETKEGNYWSEWRSKNPYPIDGNANSTDPYPLNEEMKRINYEFMYLPSIILMALLFSVLGKRKQKLKNND